MDVPTGHRVIAASERIVANFTAGNWDEIGLLTESTDYIHTHSRLLRSLSWQDEDYASNALSVLTRIVRNNPSYLPIIEDFLDRKYPGESHYISAKPSDRKITFAPNVFTVPDGYLEPDLIALMMPFSAEFNAVSKAIKEVCEHHRLRCVRVDDIWNDSAIIQDIFSLIFRAQVVVVDFSGKNPNVMYETGIAHTLGKHVVPLSQSLDDVPFDIKHHRVLRYLPNSEGLLNMQAALSAKLAQFVPAMPNISAVPVVATSNPRAAFDDDIPF